MSHDAESADSLIRENAALRTELLSRAEKDAEDMHRLQTYCAGLYAENADLHARMAALIEACEAVLETMSEERGTMNPEVAPIPLHRSSFALHRLAAAVAAVRRQADALLAELAAARQLQDWTRKWQSGEHIISTQMMRAMEAMDEARKVRTE